MNLENKKRFVQSYFTSVIHYGLPLLYGANNQIKEKVHRLTMACAPFANGSYGFKVSCSKLLKQINLSSVQDQIEEASAKFVNKLFSQQEHHIG